MVPSIYITSVYASALIAVLYDRVLSLAYDVPFNSVLPRVSNHGNWKQRNPVKFEKWSACSNVINVLFEARKKKIILI